MSEWQTGQIQNLVRLTASVKAEDLKMRYFYNQIGAFDFNIPSVHPSDFRVLRN